MTPDWLLYFITDRHLAVQRPLSDVVTDAVNAGIRAVQLREKDLSPRALIEFATQLRRVTAAAGALLFINDRVDVALAVDADGVHLPSRSLPVAVVRRILGPQKWIGVSTHSLEDVEAAAGGGADFVTFGPVFPTPSKLRYGEPVGLEKLAEAARHSPLPVFAVGGITPNRIGSVFAAGAHGVAMISSIMSHRDSRSAARVCLDAIEAVRVERSVDPSSTRC